MKWLQSILLGVVIACVGCHAGFKNTDITSGVVVKKYYEERTNIFGALQSRTLFLVIEAEDGRKRHCSVDTETYNSTRKGDYITVTDAD